MARTARIPAKAVTGPFGALVKTMSRRQLGEVPDSIGVMWHSRPVLMAMVGLGRKASRWDACDADLKSYAHMAVAAYVGCSFCLDYGYFEAANAGLDLSKASQVPRWRESGVFTQLEREVMAYAEAVSDTPPTVTDEQSALLLERLGPAALLELTAWIGFANLTARTNVAIGIDAQGFSNACSVPLAAPAPRTVTT